MSRADATEAVNAPIEVREMRMADVAETVRVHEFAFAGSMNARLGRGYATQFLRSFVEERESIGLVAVSGDAILGYAVGAPDGYARQLTRRTFWAGALGIARRPWLLLSARFRNAVLARIVGSVPRRRARPPDSDHGDGRQVHLVAIGVAKDWRRAGIGRRLLEAFEDRADLTGATRLSLTVYEDNHPAIRMYEAAGWRPDGERASGTLTYHKLLSPAKRGGS